jgi:ribosomal protein S18 acetylase RimI-like enzyme
VHNPFLGGITFFTLLWRSQDVQTIRLSVSPGNQPALRLYEKQGFVQEKFVQAYFGPGEDRIIMKKDGTKTTLTTWRSRHARYILQQERVNRQELQ